MDADRSFCLRRAMLSAILWCVIVTIVETINQPIGPMSLREQLCFIMLVAGSYIVLGLIWAVGAELPVSRRHPLAVFSVQLLAGTGAHIASLGLLRPLFSHTSSMGEILLQTPLRDFAGHALWANLFFGGMFTAAYYFTRHNLELRARLAGLRRVLDESEMRLREARLRHLHEQLRPATLLRALRALQERYIQDPSTGDRLFDALVAFLRIAMPGVRGRLDDGPAGMALIESYARLRNAIDPGIPRWSMSHDGMSDAAGPAPRRLLAVLDLVDLAMPQGWTLELTASASATGYAIRIRAEVEPAPAEFRRLLEALHELGSRATGRPAPGILLDVELPAPRSADCLKPGPEAPRRGLKPLHHEGGERVEHLA